MHAGTRCRGEAARSPNFPPVILSERVGAGVGAKDRRTNPGVDPQARRRKVARTLGEIAEIAGSYLWPDAELAVC